MRELKRGEIETAAAVPGTISAEEKTFLGRMISKITGARAPCSRRLVVGEETKQTNSITRRRRRNKGETGFSLRHVCSAYTCPHVLITIRAPALLRSLLLLHISTRRSQTLVTMALYTVRRKKSKKKRNELFFLLIRISSNANVRPAENQKKQGQKKKKKQQNSRVISRVYAQQRRYRSGRAGKQPMEH